MAKADPGPLCPNGKTWEFLVGGHSQTVALGDEIGQRNGEHALLKCSHAKRPFALITVTIPHCIIV